MEARIRILALVYSVYSIVPASPNGKVNFQTNFPCLINLGQPLNYFKKPTKVFNFCTCKHWTWKLTSPGTRSLGISSSSSIHLQKQRIYCGIHISKVSYAQIINNNFEYRKLSARQNDLVEQGEKKIRSFQGNIWNNKLV